MIDVSKIDLAALDKENLEKVKLMLDISKIQQSIVESQATVEKMRKETKYFPWVPLVTAMVGGLVVFLLTMLIK